MWKIVVLKYPCHSVMTKSSNLRFIKKLEPTIDASVKWYCYIISRKHFDIFVTVNLSLRVVFLFLKWRCLLGYSMIVNSADPTALQWINANIIRFFSAIAIKNINFHRHRCALHKCPSHWNCNNNGMDGS